MAVDFDGLTAAYESTIKEASINARSASSINQALDIQAEGYAQALKTFIQGYTSQARVNGTGVVNGGTCTDGGPVSAANVVEATIS